MRQAIAADYLIREQPSMLRTRLMETPSFLNKLGLRHRTNLTIASEFHFDRASLFASSREAYKTRKAQILVDVTGRSVKITANKTAVKIEGAASSDSARTVTVLVPELLMLCRDAAVRVKVFERFLRQLQPPYEELGGLRTLIAQRELSDDEMDLVTTAMVRSVTAVQARAAISIGRGQGDIATLIPETWGYYEKFCGPIPDTPDSDAYVRTSLTAYREKLLADNLELGLGTCLVGALHENLSPGRWTANVRANELWRAITKSDVKLDPFSLLGALDIALYRQADRRFRDLATSAILKLTEEKFIRDDGNDAYELLPIFVQLVLNRLNSAESGSQYAPYWKRLCAWMQGIFLLRMTTGIKFEIEDVKGWARLHLTALGAYVGILDLRREPMYRAAETSPVSLRCEIIGRLLLLMNRHETAGRAFPKKERVSEAAERLLRAGQPFGWVLPGPVDQQPKPGERLKLELPDKNKNMLVALARKAGNTRSWNVLAYYSQLFNYDDVLREEMRKSIARLESPISRSARAYKLDLLGNASLVATAIEDKSLAGTIADKVISRAFLAESEQDVADLFRALLISSTATRDGGAWAEWTRGVLIGLAQNLPAGKASAHLVFQLKELAQAVSLSENIVAPALAIANAGA